MWWPAFSLPFARSRRYKRSFLLSNVWLWNDRYVSFEVFISSTVSTFKNNISNCFNYPLVRNYLFNVADRTTSIHHTRLWLNLIAINHGLFKINCAVSSPCNFVMLRLKMLNTSAFALPRLKVSCSTLNIVYLLELRTFLFNLLIQSAVFWSILINDEFFLLIAILSLNKTKIDESRKVYGQLNLFFHYESLIS